MRNVTRQMSTTERGDNTMRVVASTAAFLLLAAAFFVALPGPSAGATDGDHPYEHVPCDGSHHHHADQDFSDTQEGGDDHAEDPCVDLAITKSDAGVIEIAGGDTFDYTLTVANIGDESDDDVPAGDDVTVTDQLPDGLGFVAFPDNCVQSGQTLTCALDAADLTLGSQAIVITVTVRALADAPSGIYTNLASVDTYQDPACEGEGCVPVCDGVNNNVDCEETTIKREASLTIDKVDNVDGAVGPGDIYSYMITVTNPGPSTFVADLAMIDDLPADLHLKSVSAGEPWDCTDTDPVQCTYGQPLAAGASAPTVTITVQVDSDFMGDSIHNVAIASAVVDPPIVDHSSVQSLTTSAPGTVVSASDDEMTAVVRIADLSIDKSVSQSSAVAGAQLNWFLAVTNHGPDTAANVVISDTLPSQFGVVGVIAPTGVTCSNFTNNAVTCTAPALPSGQTVTVQVQVKVLPGAAVGSVANTATVTAGSTDPDVSNNSDTASLTINTAAVASQAPVPPATAAGVKPQLPRTGNHSLSLQLTLATLLFGAGIGSLVVATRRRSTTA